RHPGRVQDADENVTAEAVGAERVRGGRRLQAQGEVRVRPRVVHVDGGSHERHQDERDDHDEPRARRRARHEPSPCRRDRALAAPAGRDGPAVHRDFEGRHASYLMRGSTAAYSTSVRRFTPTTMTAMKRLTPCTMA